MTEDLVKQSIAELRDLVRCRRHMVDAVQVVADRIEELEASLQDARRVGAEWFEQSKQNHKRATTAEAKLAKAMGALDDLISTYVWVREDEYERGWSEMSNAVHEATFVQMELKEQK